MDLNNVCLMVFNNILPTPSELHAFVHIADIGSDETSHA